MDESRDGSDFSPSFAVSGAPRIVAALRERQPFPDPKVFTVHEFPRWRPGRYLSGARSTVELAGAVPHLPPVDHCGTLCRLWRQTPLKVVAPSATSSAANGGRHARDGSSRTAIRPITTT